MEQAAVQTWIDQYEQLWRTPGTDRLRDLFTENATYSPSPWKQPIAGLPAIAEFWESQRASPDEQFTMTRDVIAIDGEVAVVRTEVNYETGSRWRNMWIVRLDNDGRCTGFEEWPFAPNQRDGHE